MKRSESDPIQANICAERLKALGDPLRLRIVDLLRQGEMAVSDIAVFLDATVVNVSHHLQILKQSELVSTRREGKFIYYRLQQELVENQNTNMQQIDLGCCKLELPAGTEK